MDFLSANSNQDLYLNIEMFLRDKVSYQKFS